MRITPGMTSDNALYNLQKGRTLLNRLQEQISSGSVINRPSDDPITSRQLLDIENKIDNGEQYLSNITEGKSLAVHDGYGAAGYDRYHCPGKEEQPGPLPAEAATRRSGRMPLHNWRS